jgi:hypothetical protein
LAAAIQEAVTTGRHTSTAPTIDSNVEWALPFYIPLRGEVCLYNGVPHLVAGLVWASLPEKRRDSVSVPELPQYLLFSIERLGTRREVALSELSFPTQIGIAPGEFYGRSRMAVCKDIEEYVVRAEWELPSSFGNQFLDGLQQLSSVVHRARMADVIPLELYKQKRLCPL